MERPPLMPDEVSALKNVGSPYPLIDTVGIVNTALPQSSAWDSMQMPPGWFTTWADAGAVQEWPLFNMRTRADTPLCFNNQEARDATTYPILIHGIGVSFFGPQTVQLDQSTLTHHHALQMALWANEIPQHTGLILKVQQDELLKINCMMCGSGNGPIGGGYGQLVSDGATDTYINYAVASTAYTQGVPTFENVWPFSSPIGVPKQAALSVTITLPQWVRRMLQALDGPFGYRPYYNEGHDLVPVLFGVQVTLYTMRALQKRGERRFL